MDRKSELRNIILRAKHEYYYSSTPIMTDAEYDAAEDELRVLDPLDPVLSIVGTPVPAASILKKAEHSIPMGSQNKVNGEGEFRAWCERQGVSTLNASLKGDGASAAAYYRDGRLIQAISRGDGRIGEDITGNAMRFKGLPSWVESTEGPFNGAVRFEVILTVDDWRLLDPEQTKNPRNAGNGIMGRKNGAQSELLTIFAFDIDESRSGVSVAFKSEREKLARLKSLGFNVISNVHCETVDAAVSYYHHISTVRDSLSIWIDGVVLKIDDLAHQKRLGITSDRPKGQVAWKFDSSGAESVVEEVVISGGHTGALIPTAKLTPIEIGGTTVSNASLANFDEILRLDVAIGDSVWVVKANDIIPKITHVTRRSSRRDPIQCPTQCPFCSGEVGRRSTHDGSAGAIVECKNPECSKKSVGKIRRWISSLEIKGIGDSVLNAMIEAFNLEDAAALYTLHESEEKLAEIIINSDKAIKLGEKRAANILREIDAKRNLSLSQFLGSFGTTHLGKRRVQLMIDSADGALSTLDDWQFGKLRSPHVAAAAGVPNIGNQIQDGIDLVRPVIAKMIAAGVTVIDQCESKASTDELNTLGTVCISGKLVSGMRKTDYLIPLKDAGYALVENVAKGLNYLVLADPASNSSKANKARALGISIISEDELRDLIDCE